MKAYIKVILAFFAINNLAAQVIPSFCNLNDTIAYRYKDDADRLALRHTYRYNSTWKDSTWIDQQLSNRYLKAFIAVHNATMILARDTVVSWLKIHTLAQNPELREFYIAADSNLVWMKNLRDNITPCSQPLVDAAIVKYGFQKTSFDVYPGIPWYTVYWNASYNINGDALASAIGSSVTGITTIGGENGYIDGINVRDSLNSNWIELVYAYRWGDCYAGCMYEHYWIFRVYNDCSVEYRGSFGPQLPVWASIQTQTNKLSDVKIYPVPSKDKIIVESQHANVYFLKVYNTLGQEVLRLNEADSKTEVDFSDLEKAVYFIQVKTSAGQQTFKVIIE